MVEELEEGEIEDFLSKGWIKAWCAVEVMAVSKRLVEESLKKHIGKLKKEEGIKVYGENYDSIEEVEEPPKNVDQAYSQVVELEFMASSLSSLVNLMFLYGPSAVEILEPEEIKLKMGEAQDMLNTIAGVMHQYASQGVGGIVLSPK